MAADSEPLTLAVVETQFAEWRRTRTNLQTPLWLKKQAVELLSRYGKSQILKELKISHAMFKRWHREVAGESTSSFISLPRASVTASVEERARLKVTHQRHDGEAISIEGELSEGQWRWALGLLSTLSP